MFSEPLQPSLTLARIDGLFFSVGNGISNTTMTFTGPIAAINAALDGLVFQPTLDFTGPASLGIARGLVSLPHDPQPRQALLGEFYNSETFDPEPALQ